MRSMATCSVRYSKSKIRGQKHPREVVKNRNSIPKHHPNYIFLTNINFSDHTCCHGFCHISQTITDITTIVSRYSPGHHLCKIWCNSTMHKLAEDYKMNPSQGPTKFHRDCKTVVRTKQWRMTMADFDSHTILRMDRHMKFSFKMEQYLYLVNDYHYRHAMP